MCCEQSARQSNSVHPSQRPHQGASKLLAETQRSVYVGVGVCVFCEQNAGKAIRPQRPHQGASKQLAQAQRSYMCVYVC